MNLGKLATVLLSAPICFAAWAGGPAPRFDFSTEDSARASNRAVAQQLPADRRELLAAAIVKLGMVGGAVPFSQHDGTPQVGISSERIKAILSGKTAEEVIALAETTASPVKSVEFKGSGK